MNVFIVMFVISAAIILWLRGFSIQIKHKLWLNNMQLVDEFKKKVMLMEFERQVEKLELGHRFELLTFEISDSLPSHADIVKSNRPLELKEYFSKEEIRFLTGN